MHRGQNLAIRHSKWERERPIIVLNKQPVQRDTLRITRTISYAFAPFRKNVDHVHVCISVLIHRYSFASAFVPNVEMMTMMCPSYFDLKIEFKWINGGRQPNVGGIGALRWSLAGRHKHVCTMYVHISRELPHLRFLLLSILMPIDFHSDGVY